MIQEGNLHLLITTADALTHSIFLILSENGVEAVNMHDSKDKHKINMEEAQFLSLFISL